MKVSIVCKANVNIDDSSFASLLNQTLDDIEIILPDEHYFKDSRVTHGVVPSGEYLLLTDMQCIFSPNMLEVMTHWMDEVRADLGVCGRNVKGVKSAVITTVANTDDKKFALVQRLISRRLLFTPNNAVIRNNGSGNFCDSYIDYVKNEWIYCFSNDFVKGGGKEASKEQIFEVLDYFLGRRF